MSEQDQIPTDDRKKQDPILRALRDAARKTLASAVHGGKLQNAISDAIRLLINVDRQKSHNSLFQRILEAIKETGEATDIGMFKKFRVGTSDMRQAIFQAQDLDNPEWISATTTTNEDGEQDTVYQYVGASDEMPDGYPGPIRRQRNVGSTDDE